MNESNEASEVCCLRRRNEALVGEVIDCRARVEALEAEVRAADRATSAEAAKVADRDRRIAQQEISRASHMAAGVRKDKEITRLRGQLVTAEGEHRKAQAWAVALTKRCEQLEADVRDLGGDEDHMADPAEPSLEVREVPVWEVRDGDKVTVTFTAHPGYLPRVRGLWLSEFEDGPAPSMFLVQDEDAMRVTRPVEPEPSLPIPQGEAAVARVLLHGSLEPIVLRRRVLGWEMFGTSTLVVETQIRQVLAVLDEGTPVAQS